MPRVRIRPSHASAGDEHCCHPSDLAQFPHSRCWLHTQAWLVSCGLFALCTPGFEVERGRFSVLAERAVGRGATEGVDLLSVQAIGTRMRYRYVIADSARWDGFSFRAGDIVISTPPKCGTTWTQMLCTLLIFDGPVFPAELDQMSPWMDMSTRSIADVWGALAAQTHRRFIKTHTPLDGLPLREDVTYLVVGRDPRDVAISYEHHATNMDFEHFLTVRAAAVGNHDLGDFPARVPPPEDPVERFRLFVNTDRPEWATLPCLGCPAPAYGLAASARRQRGDVSLLRLQGGSRH